MARKITDTTAFKATVFETSQGLLWQIRLDVVRMEQSSTAWCPRGR